jgi:hypothetical protein
MASAAVVSTEARPWYVTGLLTLAVVLTLSLSSWYLFADPEWSLHNSYPFPVNAVLSLGHPEHRLPRIQPRILGARSADAAGEGTGDYRGGLGVGAWDHRAVGCRIGAL